jgi:hypothetical protein
MSMLLYRNKPLFVARNGRSLCRSGASLRLQPHLPSSASLRRPTPRGETMGGCSALDFRRGPERQILPRGAATSGSAAGTLVPGGGSVRRKLLPAHIYGKFRIIHRQKPWLAMMMLGAAFMGHAARRNIGSVERTITILAYRCPFARQNNG